mgnify:CR=1 FL=1
MAKIDVQDIQGKVVDSLELNDAVYGIEPSSSSVHSVVVMQLANKRQGTHSTLTRAEVRGGGRKPWRQKGTDRARVGSTRNPVWRSGGVAFGPKPRDYSYTMPKKIRRLALRSVLSDKLANKNMIVLDSLSLSAPKTKDIKNILSNLKAGKTAIIVTLNKEENVVASANNLQGVSTTFTGSVNVYDLMRHQTLVITKEAALKLEEVLLNA